MHNQPSPRRLPDQLKYSRNPGKSISMPMLLPGTLQNHRTCRDKHHCRCPPSLLTRLSPQARVLSCRRSLRRRSKQQSLSAQRELCPSFRNFPRMRRHLLRHNRHACRCRCCPHGLLSLLSLYNCRSQHHHRSQRWSPNFRHQYSLKCRPCHFRHRWLRRLASR
jgi:hypothetical protein